MIIIATFPPQNSRLQWLEVFDSTLRAGISKVLNVDLSNNQWLQASLPVGEGGLGIRSAQMLAPSAFLASAASTSALQQSILPDSVSLLEDQSDTSTETRWSSLSGSTRPANEELHNQKARDKPVTKSHQALVLSRAVDDVDKARLLTAASSNSGDCCMPHP